jgi:hypothetical protein
MINNLYRLISCCVGLKLLAVLVVLILPIIILYQLILTLFIPCFYNVLIVLVQFCILISLLFWCIFG